jgi:hypothetical protein
MRECGNAVFANVGSWECAFELEPDAAGSNFSRAGS